MKKIYVVYGIDDSAEVEGMNVQIMNAFFSQESAEWYIQEYLDDPNHSLHEVFWMLSYIDLIPEFVKYLDFLSTKGYKEYKRSKLREYFLEYLLKEKKKGNKRVKEYNAKEAAQ
jgi:hypothetical protein